ncbi:Hypothetical protein PBC10988_23680 [Planctomycetales bacterium 10988]|nr:Hypothetical protein PBC10988_23680 [Planctomycetales bacterium 10988]
MSLRKFWQNVRLGASLLVPTVMVDSPHLSEGQLTTMLADSDLWLTPRAVEGYQERDFEFLEDGERAELTSHVNAFQKIAQQVPSDQPATDEQHDQALPHFRKIVQILNPRKYADLAAFKIGKQVERLIAGELPKYVQELRFQTGSDSTGDPGIWVLVIVNEKATDSKLFSSISRQVRDLLFGTIQDLEVDYWPYINFRSESEQRAIEQGSYFR